MAANLTTVNIKKEYQKELRKLSQSWGMSQVEFINNAIWYFKKTGINPKSTIFSPKEEIAKLEKRLDQVVKFLRHQEKDKLTPLLDELIITQRRLKETLALGVDKEDFDSLQNRIAEIEKVVKGQDEKNKKYMAYTIAEIFKVLRSQLKEISQNREEIAVTKIHLDRLISLLFNALNNRSIAGKFSQDDINKFQDALY
jgi:hypothetical protein